MTIHPIGAKNRGSSLGSPLSAQVQVETASNRFTMVAGSGCAATASAPGSVTVTLPPLGYAVCAAGSDK